MKMAAMEDRAEALVTLAQELGADKKLCEAITNAERDSHAYAKRHADELGLESPITDLGWHILVYGLKERRRLTMIDGRERPSEAVKMLAVLWSSVGKPPKGAWAWMKPELEKATLPKWLDEAARNMAKSGHVLVYFDVGSDAFALTIIPKAQLAKLKKLVDKTGYVMGTKFAGRPRAQSLFNELDAPSGDSVPLVGQGLDWNAVDVRPFPRAQFPQSEAHYAKQRDWITTARLLAWPTDRAPHALRDPEWDHALLTKKELVFARRNDEGVAVVPLGRADKAQLAVHPTPRRGVVILRLVQRDTWRWIVCSVDFAVALEKIVRPTAKPR